MKRSSASGGPPTIDKPTAWACTLTNAATLPGLGTIAGGRKVGYVQAGCALVGFGLSFGGLLAHLRLWFQTGEMPDGFTVGLLVAVLGMMLYAAAWLWALSSSIRLHRQASRPATPGSPHDGSSAPPPPRL